MGESTDYNILLIVGIVGFVAILAMSLSVVSESRQSTTLVGQATTTSAFVTDYNADGVLDAADAQVLADVIAFADCPHGTTCDLNLDGVVDEQDLAVFNENIPAEVEQAPVRTSVVPTRLVGYSTITTRLA